MIMVQKSTKKINLDFKNLYHLWIYIFSIFLKLFIAFRLDIKLELEMNISRGELWNECQKNEKKMLLSNPARNHPPHHVFYRFLFSAPFPKLR